MEANANLSAEKVQNFNSINAGIYFDYLRDESYATIGY